MTDSFDISTMAAADTAQIKLTNPKSGGPFTRNGQQLGVTGYGPGSKEMAAARSAANARAKKRALAAGDDAEMTPEEQAEERAELLSDITISFDGFDYKGKTGKEAFKAAYMDPTIGWLAEQVNRGLGNWGNFTPGANEA